MKRACALVLFVPYLAFLLYVTIVDYTPPGPAPDERLNLVPFRSIAYFWTRGGWPAIVNLVGNIAVFVPLGLLVPKLLRRPGTMTSAQALLAGAGFSLLIETIQYAEARRVADIDDVILNAAGTLFGFLMFRLVRWMCRRASPSDDATATDSARCQNERLSSASIARRSSSGTG